MDITSLNSLNNGTGNAQASANTLSDNFDTFLTLLTTQLQNQDPLEPLDTAQFTEQLVQYSQVEQSIATNQNLETLISLNASTQAGTAVSYIGKTVTAEGNTAALSAGQASWRYDLSQGASAVALSVVNGNGQTVFTSQGETAAGSHDFVWDGQDASGSDLPDGLYTLQVTALDQAGNPVSATTAIHGPVTGVDFSGPEPVLSVDGVTVPVGAVRLIEETAA